jgi:hypothetical protein
MSNPYAAKLGSRDEKEVIAASPARLSALLEKIGSNRVESKLGPGKWSVREILCHLADTEIAFSFRLRQILAEPDHVIQPFDQDQWARHYRKCSAQQALEVFTALRQWNTSLVSGVSRSEWSKAATHPERGALTFATIVQTMAGHDLNHLEQLEKIAAQAA